MSISYLIPLVQIEDIRSALMRFSDKCPGIHPMVISFSAILRYIPDVVSRLPKVEQWDEMEQNRKRYRNIGFVP